MRARLRTPVGARLERCRISLSISAVVRRSASSFEPQDPFNVPPLDLDEHSQLSQQTTECAPPS
jgi:hypothetical protein